MLKVFPSNSQGKISIAFNFYNVQIRENEKLLFLWSENFDLFICLYYYE